MRAAPILSKMRCGAVPDAAELAWFARGLADGTVSDAQAGAFAMAVCTRGLGQAGRVHLTRAMQATGRVVDWGERGPVLDKHSTGGVGDCVSLLLAPALAACGALVPMVSGRGLGHTGGTLDKLEAIPGLGVEVSLADMQAQVRRIGCAICAAGPDVAPADRRLYGVRDVTGTVASIDLITASILSKKLAEGLEALVLDVKTGSGAFMPERSEALDLARALVATAQGAGCMTSALVTDMSQPLARSAGNAVEVAAIMEALTDPAPDAPLVRLTVALGGEALALGGLAADVADGERRIADALQGGEAAEVFGRLVAAQGGPADFVGRWRDRLPAAPVMVDVCPTLPGHVAAIDTRALGAAVVDLGGGRRCGEDRIDPAVGLSDIARIGSVVAPDTPLLRIHAGSDDDARALAGTIRDAFTLSRAAPPVPDLILERLG